jgi:hypothetical protein
MSSVTTFSHCSREDLTKLQGELNAEYFRRHRDDSKELMSELSVHADAVKKGMAYGQNAAGIRAAQESRNSENLSEALSPSTRYSVEKSRSGVVHIRITSSPLTLELTKYEALQLAKDLL